MHAEASIRSLRRKAVWGGRAAIAALGALLASSCGQAVRTGQGPVYLMLTSLTGAKGGGSNSGSFTSSLPSDVVTLVPANTGTPTVFADNGQATVQLQMKDVLEQPTAANAVTLTQYHVRYMRS